MRKHNTTTLVRCNCTGGPIVWKSSGSPPIKAVIPPDNMIRGKGVDAAAFQSQEYGHGLRIGITAVREKGVSHRCTCCGNDRPKA